MGSILLALVAALAGAALALFLRGRQTARREAFQALAARRGWSLTVSDQVLGRPAVLRLASRSGPAWTAETRTRPRSTDGTPEVRTTEFEAGETRWTDGLLVIGAAPAAETEVQARLLLGVAEGPQGQRMLSETLGERMAADAEALSPRPASPGLIVLASAPPEGRLDLDEVAAILTEWEPVLADERGLPVLILGRDGLRLRLRHDLQRPEVMERFVDFALGFVRGL